VHLKKYAAVCSLAVFLFLTGSCTRTGHDENRFLSSPIPIKQVGILPFTGGPRGNYYADLLEADLHTCGINVAENNKIKKILTDSGYDARENPHIELLPQLLNKKAGLSFFLIGSITAAENTDRRFDDINIDLRLMDLEAGEIIWASQAEYWTTAKSKQGDARRAMSQLADDLCNKFANQSGTE